jgi:hypothetical protein
VICGLDLDIEAREHRAASSYDMSPHQSCLLSVPSYVDGIVVVQK